MKKNGFTALDIIIVIGVLSLSALIVLPSVSNALKEQDNKEEVYQNIMNSYLSCAEKYASDNKEELKKNNNTLVSINELVEKKYILAVYGGNDIIDIRDNTTKLNNVKIKLVYDEESDSFRAEYVS